MQWQFIFLVLLMFWLLLLSVFAFWLYWHLKALIKEAKGSSFVKVLEGLVKEEKKNSRAVVDLNKVLQELKTESLLHVQKIGLVRFNPFKETGGDHSFSIAVLDAKDNGFVLTGLHARERARLYAKEVVGGASEHNLSKEEIQAIKKAK